MAGIEPLFGPSVKSSLPSIAGTQSGAEEVLLEFLKEIDEAFIAKQTKLLKELDEVKSICETQEEEINNLRGTLQNIENIPKEVESNYVTHDECNVAIADLQASIRNLTTENERLKKQITDYQQPQLTSTRINEGSGDYLPLQEEVNILREKLRKNMMDKLFIKENCDKLIRLSSKLQEILDKETEKAVILTKYPDLREFTEDLIFNSFKRAITKEEPDLKKIESELFEKITSIFETLIPED